jgi:hypothetical protein
MRGTLRAALTVVTALVLTACEGENLFVGVVRDGTPAARPGTIQGSVTSTGTPVGAAWVVLLELRDSALTDSQGRFVFRDVPAATYTLSLKAPLHFRLVPGDSGTQSVTVPAGGVGFVSWRLTHAGPLP